MDNQIAAPVWQQVFQFAWSLPLYPLTALLAVMALLLLRARPGNRRILINTFGFYLMSGGGLLLSGLLAVNGQLAFATPLHNFFMLTLGMAAIRLGGLFLFRLLLPVLRIRPPSFMEDILVILAYVAWGLIRLRYAGLDLGSIVTTSAILTAVIAFSMQDTLGNILGGLALQMDNSIAIGDWISVGDINGRIVDIRWRSMLIETRNWESVVVPNSVLMKNQFSVLGRRIGQPTQWRRWIWFNVPYTIAPSRVIEAVEEALQSLSLPCVATSPLPNCVMMDFDASAGRYAVRYWLTDLAADDPTDSAVRVQIYAALKRAGIPLALPQQQLHFVQDSEGLKAARRAREIAARMEWLDGVDLFHSLTVEERRTVAEQLVYTPFAQQEVITRQGAMAHWLYIITDGQVEVVLEGPNEQRHVVSTLATGDIFGEMGLMTGEPRRATVQAATDTVCYRLDKSSFEKVLHARPSLAEDLSRVMADRRIALDMKQHEMDEQTRLEQLSSQQSELLQKIRHFFGLGNTSPLSPQ
ncbi:MAG TPA: mechanosensitive ion channel family protein [Gammaproteobacteria bacterium]